MTTCTTSRAWCGSTGPKDAVEAAILVHVLASEGIPAREVGGSLAITWPEFGGDALLVEIWVPESKHREAKAAITAYQARRSAADAQRWTCPSCQEENEASFEVCWSCQAPRPTSHLPVASPELPQG